MGHNREGQERGPRNGRRNSREITTQATFNDDGEHGAKQSNATQARLGQSSQAKKSLLDSGSEAYVVGRKDFPPLSPGAERDGFRFERRRRSRLAVTGSASAVGPGRLADCHCVGKP